jgi:hypothetical protein
MHIVFVSTTSLVQLMRMASSAHSRGNLSVKKCANVDFIHNIYISHCIHTVLSTGGILQSQEHTHIFILSFWLSFFVLDAYLLYYILCYFCLVCQVGEMAVPSFQCLDMAISDFTNDAFQ